MVEAALRFEIDKAPIDRARLEGPFIGFGFGAIAVDNRPGVVSAIRELRLQLNDDDARIERLAAIAAMSESQQDDRWLSRILVDDGELAADMRRIGESRLWAAYWLFWNNRLTASELLSRFGLEGFFVGAEIPTFRGGYYPLAFYATNTLCFGSPRDIEKAKQILDVLGDSFCSAGLPVLERARIEGEVGSLFEAAFGRGEGSGGDDWVPKEVLTAALCVAVAAEAVGGEANGRPGGTLPEGLGKLDNFAEMFRRRLAGSSVEIGEEAAADYVTETCLLMKLQAWLHGTPLLS